MNKLFASYVALSGVAITGLAITIVKKNNSSKHKDELLTKLSSFNNIAVKVILAQYNRPDGAGMMVPESLRTELDAFLIMSRNDMI